MGCVSIREKILKEEIAIILMEDQLEYFKNNCIAVDSIIRKYSTNGLINSMQ